MVKNFLEYAAMLFIAVIPDVASGVLVAHLLLKIMGYSFTLEILGCSQIFGMELSVLLIYAVGVFFALVFPDLDIIMKGAVKGHRSPLHYPLIVIPAAACVVWLFSIALGALGIPPCHFWILLVCVSLLLHFIHDSLGAGEGIAWLAPFHKKAYKLFKRINGRIRLFPEAPMELAKTLYEWGKEDLLTPTAESIGSIVYTIIVFVIVLLW